MTVCYRNFALHLSNNGFDRNHVHVVTGSFSHGVRRTAALAIGVLLGAQVGALLSNLVKGRRIIQGLAIALGFVGVRILIMDL
ncbi:MAG TPA: hypothetical protein VMZ04_02185 [Anaerolineae bacterium]|nr:hypothetical protein [Anaerolineae bacterium]